MLIFISERIIIVLIVFSKMTAKSNEVVLHACGVMAKMCVCWGGLPFSGKRVTTGIHLGCGSIQNTVISVGKLFSFLIC